MGKQSGVQGSTNVNFIFPIGTNDLSLEYMFNDTKKKMIKMNNKLIPSQEIVGRTYSLVCKRSNNN